MKRAIVIALSLWAAASVARAEDWPCWRGPRGDGTSAETNLPLTWSAKDNVAWKAPVPGVGHSSPVVSGDRVFVTTCLLKEQKRVLVCLDRRDGHVRWQRDVFTSPLEPKHKLNSYASATPATDGKLVWVSFVRLRPQSVKGELPIRPREKSPVPPGLAAEMVVTCFDIDGNRRWEKVPGQFYSRHGFCSHVVPYKDSIILNGDQDAQAYLVALDKETGTEKWRIDRPKRIRSYCAPLIQDVGGKMQMVLTGADATDAYDPDTGAPLWHMDGPTEQYVASPVYGDGVFFLTAGFPDYHNWAIRPGGKGNISKTHVAWHESKTIARKAAYVPSPVHVPGHFWVISDLGYLSSFDAKSGKRTFLEHLGRHHSASPVVAAGHVYLTDDDGVTHVLKAGGTFEPVARNPLGEECYSSPAVSHGQLFIRTSGHVWCIGKP
jgi:outer membrane protein assembly factor BamB